MMMMMVVVMKVSIVCMIMYGNNSDVCNVKFVVTNHKDQRLQ